MKFSIDKDGIWHEYELPVIRGLLCKLGFHAWNYWHMAPSFIEMVPDQVNVCRDCVHCKWLEWTHDGRIFRGRV